MCIQALELCQVEGLAQVRVDPDCWVSEAARWPEWTHVGTLEATQQCDFLSVRQEGLLLTLGRHVALRQVTCEYAQKFHSCIASSSAAHRPTDLEVPGTDFEEILIDLSDEVKLLVAGIAFEALRSLAWFWSGFNPHDLCQEVVKGLCLLFVNREGQVERLVRVAALSTSDGKGHVFAQIGSKRDGQVAQQCLLRGGGQAA